MSDNYLDQLLSEDEKIILVTRQHWLFLLGQITPELILILLILAAFSATWALLPNAGFSTIGYLFVILPLISLVRDLLIWSNNKHVVTSRRVIHMSGVWSKNVTDSSLEKALVELLWSQTRQGRSSFRQRRVVHAAGGRSP